MDLGKDALDAGNWRAEPIGDLRNVVPEIADLVDGIYRLLHSDFSEPVNIGNPSEITVLELAEEIIAMVPGTQSKVVYRDLPQDDPKRRRPDITRAQTILGWNPTIDRADGLRRTLEYFKAVL